MGDLQGTQHYEGPWLLGGASWARPAHARCMQLSCTWHYTAIQAETIVSGAVEKQGLHLVKESARLTCARPQSVHCSQALR